LSGDGVGGTESYVGDASDVQECAALVQSTQPRANGATYPAAGGSTRCYAEFGMAGADNSTAWQTCRFPGAPGLGCMYVSVSAEGEALTRFAWAEPGWRRTGLGQLPSGQRRWLGEWIRTWGGAEPPPEPRQAWANRSANRSVDGAETCEAVGRPYAAALSPLPCRRALPVLVVMWFASLVAASLLCATCTVSACTERRYSSDQRWEQAVRFNWTLIRFNSASIRH